MKIINDLAAAKAFLLERSTVELAEASPSIKQKIRDIFGEDLTPQEAVRRIINEVRAGGDHALNVGYCLLGVTLAVGVDELRHARALGCLILCGGGRHEPPAVASEPVRETELDLLRAAPRRRGSRRTSTTPGSPTAWRAMSRIARPITSNDVAISSSSQSSRPSFSSVVRIFSRRGGR